MKLNDAIQTLLDFYHVKFEDGEAVAHATHIPKTNDDVWKAWSKLGQQVALNSKEDLK